VTTTGPEDPGAPTGEAASTGGPRIHGSAPETPQPRTHRRTSHPWRTGILLVVLLIVIVAVGGYLWVDHEASPSGKPGPQVIVTIHTGTGVNQLASDLQSKGVISSSLAFKIWSQLHSVPGVLPGSYAFRKNSSFDSVKSIVAGDPNVFPVNIPPGFTVAEAAQRIGQLPGHDAATFANLANGGTVRSPWQPTGSDNLDGLLGTGVYEVVPGETDSQLLTAMIDRFDADANSLGLTAGAAKLGLTPYQVITIASIVQKEGVIAKNLGPVARVIVNRLANNMPLQMDSTVLYSEGRDGGSVSSADLKLATPYNTYLNKGLTPTPICLPSHAALAAAINPPAGSWLYFVVVEKDGTEAFADTFAQQQANEALATQRGLG
jgi:UPF0755 protein